jgi:PAS domain S-box-containing protein
MIAISLLAALAQVKTVVAPTTSSNDISPWIALAAALLSGGVVGAASIWQSHRLLPAQKQEMKLSAEKAAVEIVETALRIAQDRIQALEDQIRELTHRIEELRDVIANTSGERRRLQAQLDLTLGQRAELQQQLIDLTKLMGEGRKFLKGPRSSDAILIVHLDQQGTIAYTSDGIFTLLGYAPVELIDQSVRVLVPERVRAIHAEHRERYARDPQPRKMGSGLTLSARRRDGRDVPVDISLHPTGDGRVILLMKRRNVVSQEACADAYTEN